MNQFGERIKELRELSGKLQKQVAHHLEIDTPMLSKIEHGERYAKREHIKLFSEIFKVNEADLLSLWLADKVFEVLKDEVVALRAVHLAKVELEHNIKHKQIH